MANEVVEALAPLVDATNDSTELTKLLEELGWTPASAPQPLRDLAAAGSALLDALSTDEDTIPAEQAFAAVGQLIQAIDAIRSQPDAAFPGGIDVASFKATIGRDLFDYLAVEHLLSRRHAVGAVLRLAGIIRLIAEPAVGLRQPFLRRRIEWNAIGTLLSNPVAGFQQGFAWNSPSPAFGSALGTVASLLEQFGVQLTYFAPEGALLTFLLDGASPPADPDLGIELLVDDSIAPAQAVGAGLRLALRPPTAERGRAITLIPHAQFAIDQAVALTDQVSVSIHGNADFAQGIALTLAPGRPLELDAGFLGGVASLPADVGVTFSVAPSPSEPASVLLGSPSGSRLSVKALRVGAGAKRATDGELDAFVTLDLDGAEVVIKPDSGDADSFLASLLGDDGISASVSLGMRLSTLTGFHLSGSGTLSATYPVGVHLGPIDVRAMTFGLRPGAQGVDVEVGASIAGSIGPAAVAIDGVGFRLTTRFPDPPVGNLGPADVAFGFKGPEGVGLTLDAHGVLTGGGFLYRDSARGMYAGVLQLSLHGSLTLSAYGIIATRMPDGGPGYSLLVFITADGFRPIPLGFGFMLQSIGGMVGIHRTFDQEVLRAGLKADILGTLLFPRDPVGNAPALIQALGSAFPIRRGSYLLGLLARITWFTPTLVQLDLALILELGGRSRLLLLGRLRALLPSQDNDLIRLNLNVLGVLDFDAGTLAADAVLVDSRLVHQFPITGAAALRARWPGSTTADEGSTAGSAFVLAVGGLNPRFVAPTGFPVLERVAIALCAGTNPRLVCDAYFALTGNTVQFGARASLFASAAGFSVSGDLGFDALISLVPPHFLVDFRAAVQLKRGSHNLLKITLVGHLEGPLPLRLAAKAKFELLWFSFTVPFEFTLAAGDGAPRGLTAVAVESELRAALEDPANWRARRAPGLAHGVTLRTLVPGAGLVLDPLGQLVVEQQVVPLNLQRDVDTYGGAPVTGLRRFQLVGSLNNRAGIPVKGAFAPARYFRMSDDEKLVAPSFERLDAGLALGDGAASYDTAHVVAAPLQYEAITLNPSTDSETVEGTATVYQLPVEALQAQRPTGAVARAPVRRVGRARFRHLAARPAVTLEEPAWRVVPMSASPLASVDANPVSWSDAQAALATLNRAGAAWQLVPTHELEG